GGELFQRLGVLLQGQPVADEHVRVEHAGGEQVGGAFVAVQDGHRAGDRDLLVVDAIRLDGCPGGVVGDTELQEGAALADPAEPVLDGVRVAGGVDHDLPAARSVQFGGAGHGGGTAEQPGGTEPVRVDVDDVHGHRAGTLRELQHHQAHGAGAVDEDGGGQL